MLFPDPPTATSILIGCPCPFVATEDAAALRQADWGVGRLMSGDWRATGPDEAGLPPGRTLCARRGRSCRGAWGRVLGREASSLSLRLLLPASPAAGEAGRAPGPLELLRRDRAEPGARGAPGPRRRILGPGRLGPGSLQRPSGSPRLPSGPRDAFGVGPSAACSPPPRSRRLPSGRPALKWGCGRGVGVRGDLAVAALPRAGGAAGEGSEEGSGASARRRKGWRHLSRRLGLVSAGGCPQGPCWTSFGELGVERRPRLDA